MNSDKVFFSSLMAVVIILVMFPLAYHIPIWIFDLHPKEFKEVILCWISGIIIELVAGLIIVFCYQIGEDLYERL